MTPSYEITSSNRYVGIFFTGGSLNFARSLGPAAVNHNFPGYFWIYFVGPLLGSLLAAGFYKLLNSLRYQTCNPGQDYSISEDEKLLRKNSYSGENNAANDGMHHGATNGSEIPYKKGPSHQRNVSGATAVNHDPVLNNQISPPNHDYAINTQSPPGGVSPTNQATHMQPVYEDRGGYVN